jgi:hypothetical protein
MRLVYFAREQEQNFGVMTGKDHLPNILKKKAPSHQNGMELGKVEEL